MGGWNSEAEHTQADYDNHADQMNPNNDEYYHSRGRYKPQMLTQLQY